MRPREIGSSSAAAKGRLAPAGLALLLASALALPDPALACVRKPGTGESSVGLWVQVSGDNVIIKARGLMTFDTPAGQNCGCGFKQVDSLTELQAQAVDRNTGEPIPGFAFRMDPDTAADLERDDEGEWTGLSTGPLPQPVSGGIQADLVFTGKVTPGTSFETLKADIEAAGDVIAFGEVHNDGGFDPGQIQICPPGVVDPLPPPLTAPVLRVTAMEMGLPHTLLVTAQDTEDGLSTVRISGTSNAAASPPAFTPGTRQPVAVRLAMQAADLPARAEIEACNGRGECASLRPQIMPLRQKGPEAVRRILTGMPDSSSRLLIQNGDPGLRLFSLFVNGRRFSIRPLGPGQSLSLDVSLALTASGNTITLAGRGSPLSEAVVVLSEAPTSEQR